MASDDELKEKWSKIQDPHEALAEISKHSSFLGGDPYYSDLVDALVSMAERVSQQKVFPCPEGVEVDIVIYLMSPSTGHQVRVSVAGLSNIAPFKNQTDVASLVKEFGLAKFGDDWRMMTRAEIKAYKDSENEE